MRNLRGCAYYSEIYSCIKSHQELVKCHKIDDNVRNFGDDALYFVLTSYCMSD